MQIGRMYASPPLHDRFYLGESLGNRRGQDFRSPLGTQHVVFDADTADVFKTREGVAIEGLVPDAVAGVLALAHE